MICETPHFFAGFRIGTLRKIRFAIALPQPNWDISAIFSCAKVAAFSPNGNRRHRILDAIRLRIRAPSFVSARKKFSVLCLCRTVGPWKFFALENPFHILPYLEFIARAIAFVICIKIFPNLDLNLVFRRNLFNVEKFANYFARY